MKKKLSIILLFTLCLTLHARTKNEDVVYNFCENIRLWCSTRDVDYRTSAERLCNRSCRVKNQIMTEYATRDGITLKSCVIERYLNCFERAMSNGFVSFSVKNIKAVPCENIAYTKSEKSYKAVKEISKDISFVSVELHTEGTMKYDVKDLYVIRDGDIILITKYKEVYDRTNRKKIQVDIDDIWEDFMDTPENAFGLSYNYGKHWPLGLSIWYSYYCFYIGMDMGYNNKKEDKFYDTKANMTDVFNYQTEKTEYDPSLFLTVSPGLYLNYFSVSCGFGVMGMDIVKTASVVQDGYERALSTSTDMKYLFMLRPSVKGYLPLFSDEFWITGSVGYDFIPKCKEMSGVNFGIGIQYVY